MDIEAYIGILFGIIIFLGTLGVVIGLLYYGGSFDRMKKEAQGLPSAYGEQKPLLYDSLIEKAKTLPIKPDAIDFTGNIVIIKPLKKEKHCNDLFRISKVRSSNENSPSDINSNIWKYMVKGPFESVQDMKENQFPDLLNCTHHVIMLKSTTQLIGAFSLSNNEPHNLRIEISDVWYTSSYQGSGVNYEVVYLILEHLFSIGYRRVEWNCDAYNVPARKAAHSLGFTFEGVLRKHMIVKESNRDTVKFAALNNEWEVLKIHLKKKFYEKTKSMKKIENVMIEKKKMY